MINKNTNTNTVDCKTEEGITIGLIDSIMSISTVLADRLKFIKKTDNIEESLKDLRSDKDLRYIMLG